MKARLADRWEASSAGTRSAGFVHTLALQVLREIGIEHAGSPRGVEGFRHIPFDLVVTVCDSAAGECPQRLGRGNRIRLGLPDPADSTGSEAEGISVFRKVRDQIAEKVPPMLASSAEAR